jgi:hypothetical protein
MITIEQIRRCRDTGEFIPLLRKEFQAGEYASVIIAINQFIKNSTTNQAQVRARLMHALKPFVHNYIVGATIHRGSVEKWERRFPELLEAQGRGKKTWEEFVDESANGGPEEFAKALEVLRATCQIIENESESKNGNDQN